ncbi:MAG: serine hydrolase [bacterium]
MKNKFIYTLIIAFMFFTGCDKSEESDPSPEIPAPEKTDDGWETASLKEVGMKTTPIENLRLRIDLGVYTEVHSIIIIKDGKLVFEHYWPGHDFEYSDPNYHGELIDFDRNTRHNTHSTTKSFTSALIGIAVNDGFISSIQDSIFKYLPGHQSYKNNGREEITIEDLLKMASGLEWNEQEVSVSSSEMDLVKFNQSQNPIGYLLNKPLVAPPGTSFYYNGAGVDLLGVIIANAANQRITTFSKNKLFSPLGITNYNWVTLSPSGLICCHGDIHITPRDMAKFGYLFLNKGVWNGNRIISEEWVEKSTQLQITPGPNWGAYGYGYLWWLKSYQSGGSTYQAFRTDGWGGQQIIVFESLNMVVVFTGANYTTNIPCDEMIEEYILEAL